MSIANQPVGTREKAAERRVKALQLRQVGASYRAIARQCGVSVKTAHKDVSEALAELAALERHEAASLRALEQARLDECLLVLAPRIKAGDLGAIDRALRISESRRRLLGLDEPTTINWRYDATAEGLDPDGLFADLVERLREQMAGAPAGGGMGGSAATAGE